MRTEHKHAILIGAKPTTRKVNELDLFSVQLFLRVSCFHVIFVMSIWVYSSNERPSSNNEPQLDHLDPVTTKHYVLHVNFIFVSTFVHVVCYVGYVCSA
jgi:hypothetical protein